MSVSSRDDSCCIFLIRLAHILVPPEVLKLKGQRGKLSQTDCEFTAIAIATVSLAERTVCSSEL